VSDGQCGREAALFCGGSSGAPGALC